MDNKKIRMIFWIVIIVLSIFFGIVAAALDLSPTVRRILMAVYLTFVLISSISIDLLWYRFFNHRLKALQPILLHQRDADRYITEITALLEGKKSPQIRSVLKLNLSAAYCEKKEYEKAKELLLQIKPRKLAGTNRLIYWADLAYVYFYLQENQNAISIMDQQKVPFSKLSDNGYVGGLLAILSIFRKLAENDNIGARQLLDQSRAKWENQYTAPDFEYLEKQC